MKEVCGEAEDQSGMGWLLPEGVRELDRLPKYVRRPSSSEEPGKDPEPGLLNSDLAGVITEV